MRSHELTHAGLRLARWRSRHNLQQATFWTLVVLGPLLAFATFAVLTEMQWLGSGRMLRPVLLADFVYALVVAAFVARRVGVMIAARRRRSAGSKLHMRLVRFFTLIALIPTVLVAVFATITLNFGLEGWFSDRVRNVVANSLAAAEAYEEEHRVTLQTDARALGRLPQRSEAAQSAALRRRAARPADPRAAPDAAGVAEGLCHRRGRRSFGRAASAAIFSGTRRRRRKTSPERAPARS